MAGVSVRNGVMVRRDAGALTAETVTVTASGGGGGGGGTVAVGVYKAWRVWVCLFPRQILIIAHTKRGGEAQGRRDQDTRTPTEREREREEKRASEKDWWWWSWSVGLPVQIGEEGESSLPLDSVPACC